MADSYELEICLKGIVKHYNLRERRVVSQTTSGFPAVENVMHNLEANCSFLGIEWPEAPPTGDIGSEPVLAGLAEGVCRIEVYHGDAARLFSRAKPVDLCLVNTFPEIKADQLREACKVCGEIVMV